MKIKSIHTEAFTSYTHMEDGTIRSWGRNKIAFGQQKFTQISCGTAHSLGISNGSVYGWGDNIYQQVNSWPKSEYRKPKKIRSLVDIVQVCAGHTHSLACTTNGVVFAWGNYDRKADGKSAPRRLPIPHHTSSMAAGWEGSLFLDATAQVLTFYGSYYPLKHPRSRWKDPFQTEHKLPLIQITPLYNDTVVGLTDEGNLLVWSSNDHGQSGLARAFEPPMQVMQLPEPIKTVAVGGQYVLALSVSGRVYTWGDRLNGIHPAQNDPDFPPNHVPVALPIPVEVVQVSAGDSHILALGSDNSLWVAGCNYYGQCSPSLPKNTLSWTQIQPQE